MAYRQVLTFIIKVLNLAIIMINKYLYIPLLFSIIALTSCGNVFLSKEERDKERIAGLVEKYFPEKNANTALKCIINTSTAHEVKSCIKDKSVLSYKNPEYKVSLNILDFLYANRINTGFTPDKMIILLEKGSNPHYVADGAILFGHHDYLYPIIDMYGPNAVFTSGEDKLFILEDIISYWGGGTEDDKIIDYLASKNVNWEQKLGLSEETAIYTASRNGFGNSAFAKVHKLLDLGADPMVRDRSGRSICRLINIRYSTWALEKPELRQELADRLLKEYNMDCEYKGYRGK